MSKVSKFFRNLLCACLAIVVLGSGRARRAKRKAVSSNVVTAIYFHNPNRRLFRKCVDWLAKNGYQFISDDQLVDIFRAGAEPPKGAVWLSFDDGFKELLENVVPLAAQRHIPITIYLPSGVIEGNGWFPWLSHVPSSKDPRDSMTVADVMRIVQYPEVAIGSHTVGHIVTTSLSEEQSRYEFQESKRALESWIGRPVVTFAYPEGRIHGGEGRILAECGYQLAVTTKAKLVTSASDPYYVPRFHVGDNIWFPEAICNMVGVWRPVMDPILAFVQRVKNVVQCVRSASRSHYRTHRSTSV